MTLKKENIWEEIRRIEKVFIKQKGKDTAIILKSIEESDKLISIILSIESNEKTISIPLSPDEWHDLKKFFISVDDLIIGKNKIDKQIQKKVEGSSSIDSNDRVESYKELKIKESKQKDITETDKILNEIKELTTSIKAKESKTTDLTDKQKNEIKEDKISSSPLILNEDKKITPIKPKVEDIDKDDQESDEKLQRKKSILPRPIQLEELPTSEPLKEIPLIRKEDIEKREKSDEKSSTVIKKEDKKTELKENFNEEIKESGMKIKNLDELINEIAIIGEINDKEDESTKMAYELSHIEKEPEKLKEKDINDTEKMELDREVLRTELQEILNEQDEPSPVSADEIVFFNEINQNSPRIPQVPENNFSINIDTEEKVEAPEIMNEERIIKAMEETATLLPEGNAKNFILEMKEKRKKVIKQSEKA